MLQLSSSWRVKKQERDACRPRSPPTARNRGETMARERSELEQRRAELARSLPALSENRADTYRRNSDAVALDRAGVKHQRPQEMVRLKEAEVAADAAIRD